MIQESFVFSTESAVSSCPRVYSSLSWAALYKNTKQRVFNGEEDRRVTTHFVSWLTNQSCTMDSREMEGLLLRLRKSVQEQQRVVRGLDKQLAKENTALQEEIKAVEHAKEQLRPLVQTYK